MWEGRELGRVGVVEAHGRDAEHVGLKQLTRGANKLAPDFVRVVVRREIGLEHDCARRVPQTRAANCSVGQRFAWQEPEVRTEELLVLCGVRNLGRQTHRRAGSTRA